MAIEITPPLGKISILAELVYRGGGSGTDGKILSTDPIVACDLTKQISETLQLPEPLKQIVEIFLNTSRNVGKLRNLGYDVGESTWGFDILTGIFLYYAMGGVETTGVNVVGPFTTTSGTTGTTIEDNVNSPFLSTMVGDIIKIGTNAYTITAFIGATSVTVDKSGATTGQTYYVQTAPFTHTITESNVLPSFAIHYELFGVAEIDILGCLVKAFEITLEAGSETPIAVSVELSASKFLKGNVLTEPAELELDSFVRKDVDTYTLTYNTANIDPTFIDNSDKLIIRIENEFEIRKVHSDEFPKRINIGTRMITATYSTFIRNRLWRDIQNLDVPNYISHYGLGVQLSTPFADVIASGQGTPNLVMTTNTSMVTDEHKGRTFHNITTDASYRIISNTNDTITIDQNSGVSDDGDSIEILEATHYVGPLTSTTKIARSINDYIQIILNKLYQKPNSEINRLVAYSGDKELYANIEYGSAPKNVINAEVKDNLNSLYYGRK